jgi:hypothetical protein
MAVRDGHYVCTLLIDPAMQKSLDEGLAGVVVARSAVERELHDVVGRHELRRERARHQESIGALRMPHRYVAGGIEYPLIDEDAARGGEIFDDGAIHGVSGHP